MQLIYIWLCSYKTGLHSTLDSCSTDCIYYDVRPSQAPY